MATHTQRRRWLARAGGWLALATLGGGLPRAYAKVPARADYLILTLEKGQGLFRVVEAIPPVAIPGAAGNGPAIYDVVGDLRIEFWFLDEKLPKDPNAFRVPAELRPATFAELRALGLQPEQAVRKALANMGRMWLVAPTAAQYLDPSLPRGPHSGGIVDAINVLGLPLVGGSWMMDRALWTKMAAALGPIVVTPMRQGIPYAPLRDAKAMEWLEGTQAVNISVEYALSNNLYVFEKDRWAVFPKRPVAR